MLTILIRGWKDIDKKRMENPFKVLSLVASVLEQQQIAYVLVGSLASSFHGMYRSTADIDILAAVKPSRELLRRRACCT